MDRKNGTAYVNGKIFTSDDSRPYAEAMIVKEGRVRWIGKEAELPAGDYLRVDLGGKRVLPGFIDAHMHPIMLADFSRKISALPPAVHSLDELAEEIRKVRAKQEEGQWIQGWGYDEGKLAEKRSPNRHDLDRGCKDSPVVVFRTCGHVNCVNSKALELMGITKKTPDPQGGEIDRDENGEPTGVLRENARTLVMPLLPVVTKEKKIEQLVDLGKLLASQGVTGMSDMGCLGGGDVYGIYSAAAEKGLRQRVGIYYMWDYYCNDSNFTIPAEQMDGDRQIHTAGLKTIGDGSFSGRTAWVSEPYYGSTDEYGMPVCSDELMESSIEFCKKNHCQYAMHAMGRQAIDRIVDRIAREEKWTEEGIPHLRIEHVTEPSENAIRKTVEHGFAFATQPIFLYAEIESYLRNLGPERTKRAYPIRTLLERGVNLCFSTDSPATSWATPSDPFPNIKCAVTRYAYDGTDCGQEEAVDVETAIKLYTRNAAIVAGLKNAGQLKPGYHADFVVLGDDILTVEPEKIDRIKIQETYIDGEKVYGR